MSRKSAVLSSVLGLVAICLSNGVARADDASAAALKDGDHVAIIGDSITEQRFYSVFMEDYLLMCKPAANLQATQFGWSGDVAPGFAGRMANDMVPFGASVATTCFGMNDGGYSPMDEGKGKRYVNGQRSIIQQLRNGKTRFIIVGSPGAVDTFTFQHNPQAGQMYNQTLAALGELDKKLAAEENVTFADVHTPMIDVMAKAKAKYGDAYDVAGGDGVHPNRNGHLVMAYAFLKAMGCNGDIGTITVDMTANTAQATDGHKVLSVKDGSVSVESSKYPFCFFGDPANAGSTTGIIEFFPFNDDLNRFKLIVTNPTAARLKVTWGKTSREYSADDLKKGINLASEFLDNPFSEPFTVVEQQIAQQQAREVDLVKTRIHDLPGYVQWVPEQKDLIEKLRDPLVKADEPLRAAPAAAVKPVTHTITIQAVK